MLIMTRPEPTFSVQDHLQTPHEFPVSCSLNIYRQKLVHKFAVLCVHEYNTNFRHFFSQAKETDTHNRFVHVHSSNLTENLTS